MTRRILSIFTLLFIFTVNKVSAQSIGNYVTSNTAPITFSSIASTGNVIAYWRNQVTNQNDDNRSVPIPIGFDFWYNGVRQTFVSVCANGYIDFSPTVYDGNDAAGFPSGSGYFVCGQVSYREQPISFSTGGCGAVAPNFYDGTYLALAPFYCDLWVGSNGTSQIANSIKYLTTGSAPNRVFTVEYINMDDWATAANSDYNFQVKLYESTGVIEFVYGTMAPGPGAPPAYACGINGIISSGVPAVSELLEQQAPNSTVFNNTPQYNLTTAPTSNSKIKFSPPCAAAPTSLNFTAVGNINMTLNWTDNATNEVCYVVYQSTDGINYSFAGQYPPNTTTASFGSLYGTTYWWKVYAVTEGCLSVPLVGSQATLPAGNFVSVVTGNWNVGSTWNAGTVPTLGDNVTIANGHTVTVNGPNFGSTNLTVGQGTSGVLLMGNNATARTFTVIGNLLVNSGAQFTPNTGFVATHSITLLGNITNNGSLNFQPTPTSLIDISFIRTGNQLISGTGIVNSYNNIIMDMGSSFLNTLEVTSTNFAAPVNFLTMRNGMFKFSVPVNPIALTIFSAPVTIPPTCGLWMNSPNSVMWSQSTLNFQGDLICSNGLVRIGNNPNENLNSNGALLSITNGTVEVAGRLTRPSYVAITNFNMTGGLLILNTLGSNDASPSIGTTPAYPFHIDVAGSSFNMTGGKIVIRNSGSGSSGLVNAGYCNLNCSPYVFSGGTLQIGDATTNAGQTMKINTDQPIANLVVNNTSGNNPIALQETDLIVTQNVINNTSNGLNSNSKNLTIAGSFTNNGTYTPGTNTLTCNGSAAQIITGSSPILPLHSFVINNTSGDVTLNTIANINVAGSLQFNSGKLIIGSTNVNITSGNPVLGFNSSKYVVTNGTNLGGGFLQINNITASARDFPIGLNTTSYNPILNFSNAGTADNFQARLFQNVYKNGTSGIIETTDWVDKTWLINEATAGGSNVNMTLQWRSSNELPSFTNSNCGIRHYGPIWDAPTNVSASTGSNPYQQFRNNITTFSPFGVFSGVVVLPIELTEFAGEKKSNANFLHWQTANELNNDYFELQQSGDAIDFKTIANIDGAGTSTQINNYNHYHQNPDKIINYYRLKQTDFNKKNNYSNIISIDNTGNEGLNDIKIFPNPANNTFNLMLNTKAKSDVTVTIYDALGHYIFSTNFGTESGIQLKQIDVSDLAPAMYEIKISVDGINTYKKIVIQ